LLKGENSAFFFSFFVRLGFALRALVCQAGILPLEPYL
jgi:hypothetical protein